MTVESSFTAFLGSERVAQGPLSTLLPQVKARMEQDPNASLLVFDDRDGRQVDFDLRGSAEEILARLPQHPLFSQSPAPRNGPGRPRLGVVSREVTLLPRHWEWLEKQPQGSSAALRRLVEDARRRENSGDPGRTGRDAAAKFLWALAGDLPGFEDATRALFQGDLGAFQAKIQAWPRDIQAHALELLGRREDAAL